MEKGKAIKTFDIEEGSTTRMRYKITVRVADKIVDIFLRDTKEEARRDFEDAGYERIAWAENRRIVLQG